LKRYPSLETDEEALVDLILGEIQLRQRLGESPTLDEYLRRFPRCSALLSGSFGPQPRHTPPALHRAPPRAMGSIPTEGAGTIPPMPASSPPPATPLPARPSPSLSDVALLASMEPGEDTGEDTGKGVRQTQTMSGNNPFQSAGLREALGEA